MSEWQKRTKCILFFRDDCFYPTEYPHDYSNWQAEADRNPGTLRIEDLKGNVLWSPANRDRTEK